MVVQELMQQLDVRQPGSPSYERLMALVVKFRWVLNTKVQRTIPSPSLPSALHGACQAAGVNV